MTDSLSSKDEMRETVNRVCLGVGSIQEGQKLRAYIDELESRATPETTPNRGKVIECPWCHGAGGGKLANGDVHDCDLCNGDGGVRVFPMACDAEHPPQQVKTTLKQGE